jgi:hypothetical protein
VGAIDGGGDGPTELSVRWWGLNVGTFDNNATKVVSGKWLRDGIEEGYRKGFEEAFTVGKDEGRREGLAGRLINEGGDGRTELSVRCCGLNVGIFDNNADGEGKED